MSFNRDTIAALCLILASGGLMLASLEIREPDYGVLSPATWPRLIIFILGFLSLIYFIQSMRVPPIKAPSADRQTLPAFFSYWRNVFYVFIIFGLYLYAAICWNADRQYAFQLYSTDRTRRLATNHFACLCCADGFRWHVVVVHLCT